MERKFDHSKGSLGEACGYKEEDTVMYKELLMEQFGKNSQNPSRIVEILEEKVEPRILAMLLVGSILSTKRLEMVMEMLQSLGGEETLRKLMKMTSYSSKEEEETIG